MTRYKCITVSSKESWCRNDDLIDELLAACEDLAHWVRRRCPADDWPVEYARAMHAITKARGEVDDD